MIQLTTNPVLLFAMPGGGELILIVLAIVLLLEEKKIPELMRGIGKGIREFKDAKENVSNELDMTLHKKDSIK